jgi:hypothetical protein
MSDQHTTSQSTAPYDDPDLEWEYEDGPTDDDTPPARPRRKLLTPVSGGLLAIALVAGGFVAGVQVQKGQDDNNGGAGGRTGGFAARFGGGTAGGASSVGAGSNASGATIGTVANVKGTTLYVTGSDGTTVKIRTNDNSKVTRNADSSVEAVHPGDSVVIQGTKNSSGSVTATSITATAKGVSAFGGLGGFPGAGAGATGTAGGNAPSGGASSGRGGATGVPQGFAPPQG